MIKFEYRVMLHYTLSSANEPVLKKLAEQKRHQYGSTLVMRDKTQTWDSYLFKHRNINLIL